MGYPGRRAATIEGTDRAGHPRDFAKNIAVVELREGAARPAPTAAGGTAWATYSLMRSKLDTRPHPPDPVCTGGPSGSTRSWAMPPTAAAAAAISLNWPSPGAFCAAPGLDHPHQRGERLVFEAVPLPPIFEKLAGGAAAGADQQPRCCASASRRSRSKIVFALESDRPRRWR